MIHGCAMKHALVFANGLNISPMSEYRYFCRFYLLSFFT